MLQRRVAAAAIPFLFVAFAVASAAHAEEGLASWYGRESGHVTASGERFDPNGMTCARPSYRAGQPSYSIRVTDPATGRSIVCRVNDRGPAAWTRRSVDLAKGAAIALFGMGRNRRPAKGVAPVSIERLD